MRQDKKEQDSFLSPNKIQTSESIQVPIAKLGDAQISAYFENSQVLSSILIVNLISILGFFLKTGWEMWKKKEDKSVEQIEKTAIAMIEVQTEMRSVLSKLDQMDDQIREMDSKLEHRVELLVFKFIKDMDKWKT